MSKHIIKIFIRDVLTYNLWCFTDDKSSQPVPAPFVSNLGNQYSSGWIHKCWQCSTVIQQHALSIYFLQKFSEHQCIPFSWRNSLFPSSRILPQRSAGSPADDSLPFLCACAFSVPPIEWPHPLSRNFFGKLPPDTPGRFHTQPQKRYQTYSPWRRHLFHTG